MIRFLTISALSFAICGACSKKKDEAAAEPAKAAPTEAVSADKAPAPAAPVLVIKASKLKLDLADDNPDGPESIALEDNGNIVVGGDTVATMSADGKVVDKGGEEIASLAADGTLHLAGEEETALIGPDGSLTVDGERLASFDEDNRLVMAELSETVKFEGPDEAKPAMMVVFMVATIAGETAKETAAEEDSAEAPTEE